MLKIKSALYSGLLCCALVNPLVASAETPAADHAGDYLRPIDTVKNGQARQFIVQFDGYVPPTNWLPRIKGGKATIEAKVFPDRYDIHTRASAAGIVDWFVDYSSTLISKGEVTEKGLQPRFYTAKDDEGRKNRVTKIIHKDDVVDVEVIPEHGNLGDPAATMAQKAEAMDPISALVHLALAADTTADTPCAGVAPIFDGKARYNLHLEGGKYMEHADTEAWTGPAFICSIRYEELAGFKFKTEAQKRKEAKDLRWASMMLADMGPGELRVPIKIEARSNKRGKISVIAKKLTYNKLDVDHARATSEQPTDQG